jgi:hypothetical protein
MNRLLTRSLLLSALICFLPLSLAAQKTWVGALTGGSWTTATNWSPSGAPASASDNVLFNTGTFLTITDVPTVTIGQLSVTSNTAVTLTAQTGAPRTLTISDGAGTDLSVAGGCQLNDSGTTALTIALAAGSIGVIDGSMLFTRGVAGAVVAHRLSNSETITFNSGSSLTQAVSISGSIIVGPASSFVFNSGSSFIYQSGSNPFPRSLFNPGSYYRHQSINSPASASVTYANFEFNNGSPVGLINGNGLAIDTLFVTQSVFNFSGNTTLNTIIVRPGATLNISSNASTTVQTITGNVFIDGTLNSAAIGTLNLNGNLQVSGTATFNPASSGTPRLFALNGTSSQQIITGTGTVTFGNNQIVTVNNFNGIDLQKNITINNTLNLNNGNITTNGNTLQVGSTTEGTINRSGGQVIGTLARFKNNTTATSGFLFPVGTASFYRPLSLNFTDAPTASGVISVTHVDGIGNAPVSPTLDDAGYTLNVRSTLNWLVTTGTITGGTVQQISIDGNGNDGIFLPGELRVLRSPSPFATFDLFGAHIAGSGTTAFRGTFDPTELNNTRLYLASNFADNPLPVELIAFTGIARQNSIRLTWTTATEHDNAGFIIMRDSVPIADYQTLPSLRGLGTTPFGKTYTFTDAKVIAGKTYLYKLMSRDIGGRLQNYPLEVRVGVEPEFALEQNYPNPFNPSTGIRYQVSRVSDVRLEVFDMLGRKVSTLVNERQSAGSYEVSFNAAGLASGVYFYKLSAGSFVQTKKMLLVK